MKKLIFLVMLILPVFSFSSTLTDFILSQDPVAYWRFNETSGTTAYDSSGNNYNGSYEGTYSLGNSGSSGDGDTSAYFNGGYMSVDVPTLPSFSIFTWAKSATTTWNNYGWVASSRNPNGFIIHPSPGSKNTTMYIINQTSGTAHTGLGTVTSQVSQWHQYGITYNATTKIASVILDGEVKTTASYTGSRVSDTISIWFGRDQHGTDRYGNGWIDEAVFFNRELNANEISDQYTAITSGYAIPEPGSIFLLLFGMSCLIFRCYKK
mgnify:CR=1 FL=1